MRCARLSSVIVRTPRLIQQTLQIEYLVVDFDDEHRKVRLSLRQADILTALANDEDLTKQGGGVPEMQTRHKRSVPGGALVARCQAIDETD